MIHIISVIFGLIHIYLIELVDVLLLLYPRKATKKYDRIIIRTDGIGDFIIWCDAAKRIVADGRQTLYICPRNYADLAIKIGLFTEVLPIDKNKCGSNFKDNVKLMWHLKFVSANEIINPMKSHHAVSDFMVAMIHAKSKIGVNIHRTSFWGRLKDSFYSNLIEVSTGSIFNINASFVQKYSEEKFVPTLFDFRPIIQRGETNDKSCFISLSSSSDLRTWPMDKLAVVLKKIPASYKIILSGFGDKDVQRAKLLIQLDERKHSFKNTVNKTSLIEMVELIANSTFVLGNDSSSIHIAAACRVPSICYSAGNTYYEFVPYPDNLADFKYHPRIVSAKWDCFPCHEKCKYRKQKLHDNLYPCLNAVTPSMVEFELERLLKEIK